MERANPVRRCAIYTRKSSEEGLEQDFNSLHAQREACEAFIKSQQHEGWRLLRTAYDDGGLSGATMERPALQRLLTDIREGHIDVVVVYKVDRLTRALADFAKMVEIFDAHRVSFVAVTQHFNTTTSMGRLTLNVLLSFAQFEREVTGERIRDKIAASKRKGIWMGGIAPLGYDVRERRLVVNQAEAETVREIFRHYLELGSVRLLKEKLERRGIRSKLRVAQNGNRSGGQFFSRGALYELLGNPVYVGEIRHKGTCHPGQQRAIVDRVVWERTQRQLRQHAVRRGTSTTRTAPSALTGKLFDQAGEGLTPSHARKGGRRYRYYVSRSLMTGAAGRAKGWRLPAPEIERSVTTALQKILDEPSVIAVVAEEAGVAPSRVPALLEAAHASGQLLASEADTAALLAALVERVELREDGMRLSFRAAIPLAGGHNGADAGAPILTRFIPMEMRRRGVELRLVVEGHDARTKADPALLKAVARAHRWFDDLVCGRAASLDEIAARAGVTARYVRRVIRLTFLAPMIVEAIADGCQPAALTAERLIKRVALPLEWGAQKRMLGFG